MDDDAMKTVEIDARSIASGLVDLFGHAAIIGAGCPLPMRSGAPYSVGNKDYHWLDEEFEIVHREAARIGELLQEEELCVGDARVLLDATRRATEPVDEHANEIE